LYLFERTSKGLESDIGTDFSIKKRPAAQGAESILFH
jgi:hypothetical protein